MEMQDLLVKNELNSLSKEIVKLNDELGKIIIKFLDKEVLKVENFNEVLLTEIKNMQKQSIEISNAGGDIQSVDIQKYMYKKALDIIEKYNFKFDNDNGNDGEKGGDDNEENQNHTLDTDNDGLTDIEEEAYGGDKNKLDTDDDGLSDEFEVRLFPVCKLDNPDTDGDGISDYDEDSDGDGLSNGEEFELGTWPLNKDSDLDGLSDGDEVKKHKTNPLKEDTDDDGLNDSDEIKLGTDPLNPDTDGNGIKDGDEVFSTEVKENEIELNVKAKNEVIESLTVENNEIPDSIEERIPGQVSNLYKLNFIGELDNVNLKFNLNENRIKGRTLQNLKVMYFDEEKEVLKLVDGAQNFDGNSIDVSTNIGKEFVVVDYSEWEKSWKDYDIDNTITPNEKIIKNKDVMIVFQNNISLDRFDSENIRYTAAKNFISNLTPKDRVAIGTFNYSGFKEIQGFTEDKNLAKKSIDKIEIDNGQLSGGLSQWIKNVLYDGIDRFGDKDRTRERHLIIITGVADFTNDNGFTNKLIAMRANSRDVKISSMTYNLGLDDSDYMFDIAQETEGDWYPISKPSSFNAGFKLFLNFIGGTEIDNSGVDTDGDGLSDRLENSGLRDGYGVVRKTNPENPDTDGDGIFDGEEVGLVDYSPQEIEDCIIEKSGILYENGGKYLKFLSNPVKKDTDLDGVHDLIEVEYGSNPKKRDSDEDGLNDKLEYTIGTDPQNIDTDSDGANDGKEYNSLFLDPLSPDKYITTGEYIAAFCKGFALGDAIENPDSVNIVGAIVGNMLPGVSSVADVRDMLVNAFKQDYIMAGANLAGILPILGDSGQVLAKLSKYLENLKYGDEAIEGLNTVIKLGDKVLPSKAQLMLVEKLLISGSYADIILDFFDLNGGTRSKSEKLEEASKILMKIINESKDIGVKEFVEAIKKLDKDGLTKSYPNIGKIIERAAEDSKEKDKFAQEFLEQVSIKLKHASTVKDNPNVLTGISKRIKGYLGEIELFQKIKKYDHRILNVAKGNVSTPGADLVAMIKNPNGKDILYIAESKAWKTNVQEKSLKKYYEEGILDLEYVLESVSIEDKNIILEKIRKKELDVKFELWLFRPAESTGDGIGKK